MSGFLVREIVKCTSLKIDLGIFKDYNVSSMENRKDILHEGVGIPIIGGTCYHKNFG